MLRRPAHAWCGAVPSTNARRCWCSCTFCCSTRSNRPGVSAASWLPYTAACGGRGEPARRGSRRAGRPASCSTPRPPAALGAVRVHPECSSVHPGPPCSAPPAPAHLHAGHELGQLSAAEALRQFRRVRQIRLAHSLRRRRQQGVLSRRGGLRDGGERGTIPATQAQRWRHWWQRWRQRRPRHTLMSMRSAPAPRPVNRPRSRSSSDTLVPAPAPPSAVPACTQGKGGGTR